MARLDLPATKANLLHLKEDLLLHLVKKIEPDIQTEFIQLIQPDLALQGIFVMAGVAVGIKKLIDLRRLSQDVSADDQ